MAYAIYCLKMQLLSNQFDMNNEEMIGVKRMANFIAFFYSRAFLTSRLSTMAPAADLRFISLMKMYQTEDESAAIICIKSSMNHFWYLNQELVVLSILDIHLPSSLRQLMVSKLLSFQLPSRFESQKTKFPILIDYPNQLTTFLGPRS